MNRDKPTAMLAAATIFLLAACAPGPTAKSAPTPTTMITVGRSDPWILYQWVTPTSDLIDELWLVRPDGSGIHPLLSRSRNRLSTRTGRQTGSKSLLSPTGATDQISGW